MSSESKYQTCTQQIKKNEKGQEKIMELIPYTKPSVLALINTKWCDEMVKISLPLTKGLEFERFE